MGRTHIARASIRQLEERIRIAEERKKYFEDYLQKLQLAYASGRISLKFYVETLHLHRDGRNIQEWVDYYKHQIRECEQIIREHKKNILKVKLPIIIAISFFAIFFSFFFFSRINPQLTGFAVQQGTEITTGAGVNANLTTSQEQAVIGQPVKWVKKISLDKPSNVTIILPQEANNISLTEINKSYSEQQGILQNQTSPNPEGSPVSETQNGPETTFPITGSAVSNSNSGSGGFFGTFARLTGFAVQQSPSQQIEVNQTAGTSYEINYETPAPQAKEENIQNGKRVIVTGSNVTHYKNVLTFTNLSEKLNIRDPSEVKIHWIENNTYITPTKVEDTNGDGIYDYVEWIAPSLSTQTFDVIVVTKAEHLDSNRGFISDIYSEVKALDGVWSETIPSGDYVRVTFKENLTNKKDITLYPNVVSGNPFIEVYEKDQNVLIANFTSLNSSEYNQVFLTSLQDSQDTFDLRVVGGSVQIDYIVDPVTILWEKLSRSSYDQATANNVNAHFNTTGTLFTYNSSYYISGITTGTDYNIVQNGSLGIMGFNATFTDMNVSYLGSPISFGLGQGTANVTDPYTNTSVCVKNGYCLRIAGNKSGYSISKVVNGVLTNLYNKSITAIANSSFVAMNLTYDGSTVGWNIGGNLGTLSDSSYTLSSSTGALVDINYKATNKTRMFLKWMYIGVNDTVAPTTTLPVYTNATFKSKTSSLTLNVSVIDTGSLVGSDCVVNINGTNQSIATSSGWCNTTSGNLTNLVDGNTTIYVYANDSMGNFALNNSYVVQMDSSPPTYSNPSVNNSNPVSNTAVLHSVLWGNNGALSSATLEINSTGASCNTAANVSSMKLSGASAWANLSWLVPNACEGKTIGWREYANDTPNNWNRTSLQAYDVQNVAPVITLPVYTNATKYQNTQSLTFNISAIDSGIGTDSCVINVGGNTNQTMKDVSNWCNGTYALTGLAGGNQTINAYSNDTAGSIGLNSSYSVWIVNYALNITSPTTSNAQSVGGGDTVPIYFNFTYPDSATYLTSGVTMNSVTIGGQNAAIVGGSGGSPTFDAINSTVPADGVGECNVTLTVGSGGNVYLIAGLLYAYGGGTSNTPTVDGSVMTLINDSGAQTGESRAYMYGYKNPSAGSHAISFSGLSNSNGRSVCYAVSYTSVDQTTPYSASRTNYLDGPDPTITIASATGELVVEGDALRDATTTFAVNNGQTQRLNVMDSDTGGTGIIGVVAEKAGAASVTMNWSGSTGSPHSLVAVSLRPAATSQFAYIAGKGWQVNVTAPGGLTGLQDLFLNATYSGVTRNNTQTGAINYSIVDSTAPAITLPVYTNATLYKNTQSLTFNISAIDGGVGTDSCVINVGGNTNQTMKDVSNWCNGTYALTGISDGNKTIYVYANDTSGNIGLNNSYVAFIDSTPPTWYSNSTNSTLGGTSIKHNAYWSDNSSLSGYIFSFDNGTGSFVNDSFVVITGTSNWSNVTKVVNWTAGSTIRWIVYANDSLGNLNDTNTFSYTTTTTPKIGLSVLYPPGNVNVTQNGFFNVTLNVTCLAGTCGTINTSLYSSNSSSQIYGLNFSGSDGVTDSFNFSSPISYPATYIWQVYPRQQDSYYTAFFYGNKPTFQSGNDYYGFHPYPTFVGSTHDWEIASPNGGDWVGDLVVTDQWYQQAAVVSKSANGSYTYHTYYWNWPDTTKNITHVDTTTRSPPTNPTITVGDAPWNLGNEEWYGYMRDFQFYGSALTNTQIAQEIASPGSVTTPWYLNLNPTPTDISDKSGSGNNPTWGGTDRPALWTGSSTQTALIPMDSGTPFYTNVSNPFTTSSLSSGQSQTVTFWVNATGSVGSTYAFFAFANSTSDSSISNSTSSWNNTISSPSGTSAVTVPIVNTISAQNPTAAGATAVSVNFTAVDTNGASSINASTAQAQFSMAGQTTRSNNASCTNWSSSGNTMNFTCTVYMWYFDKNGAWTVNASVNDNSAALASNSSTTFTYNLLTSMTMSPTSLSWPTIYIASTNTGSTNNPIIVNNTGNAALLNINITAYDLSGATTTSQYIYANNFTVDNTTAGCSGTVMVNATATNVTNAILYAGNNSFNYNNATSGQEPLYFCLKGVVPTLSAQSYSSSAYGPWTVSVLFVAIIPRKRKKKIKEDRLVKAVGLILNELKEEPYTTRKNKEIKDDRLLKALGLILNELKEEYSPNKKELTDVIIGRIKEKYKLSRKDVLKEIISEKDLEVPVNIFSGRLGMLESLVKYMKENLGMNYKEISNKIERNERTVWTAYKKATEKDSSPITVKKAKIFIPLPELNIQRLTVLESVIFDLKEKGFKFVEIGKLLERDQRNIWTVYSRAKEKMKQSNRKE